MEELVKGVVLRRAGTAIERVQLRNNVTFDLLASWDGVEVARHEIPKGKRFGLRPQEDWNALEVYYFVEGEAVWEGNERSRTLGPGDCLAATPVGEPFILTALTDVVLIYVGSQPTFHTISTHATTFQDLAISVAKKDGYTVDHCQRIRDLSKKVAETLHLSPVQQYNLFHGSFLHDLGKVGIPDHVLQKPGALLPSEWELMKQHPTIGATMLQNTVYAGVAYILEQHHERLDGSGYPRGLSGEQISVEAQIVAVVDSYDAMTTDRVYRPALSKPSALSELQQGAGRLYRPDVVKAFLTVIDSE